MQAELQTKINSQEKKELYKILTGYFEKKNEIAELKKKLESYDKSCKKYKEIKMRIQEIQTGIKNIDKIIENFDKKNKKFFILRYKKHYSYNEIMSTLYISKSSCIRRNKKIVESIKYYYGVEKKIRKL